MDTGCESSLFAAIPLKFIETSFCRPSKENLVVADDIDNRCRCPFQVVTMQICSILIANVYSTFVNAHSASTNTVDRLSGSEDRP
jgi:hypothetical protein